MLSTIVDVQSMLVYLEVYDLRACCNLVVVQHVVGTKTLVMILNIIKLMMSES